MEQKIGKIRNNKKKEKDVFMIAGIPPHKYVTIEVRGDKEPERLIIQVEKPNGNYKISQHVRMRVNRKFTGHGDDLANKVEKALNKQLNS